MMILALLIWLVGVVLGTAWLGYINNNDGDVVVIVVFWPAVLVFCILASPFVGAYLLGRWLRDKLHEG